MVDAIESVVLKNGVVICFEDQSNRYFGDFHRVFVRVRISVPDDCRLPDGMKREKACLEKTLEKMGVPTAAVETVRSELIEGFLASARHYMEKEDFPQKLLLKLLTEKKRPVFLR